MNNLIYEFLDNYVGDGMNITNRVGVTINRITFTDSNYEAYNVESNNGTVILYFIPNSIGDVKIFPSHILNTTICNMFSIEPTKSKEYIREWFREKHYIIHFRELLDYIPHSL